MVEIARELRLRQLNVNAVRIDSGDLLHASKSVRGILNDGGCSDIRILVSGNLDEYSIAKLRAARAPIDGYCVGTHLSVSADAPSLDCAYKLHAYGGRPSRKRSVAKESWPGARQVSRQFDPHDRIAGDVIARADEALEGRALLQEVMVRGRRKGPGPALPAIREHCKAELATLPIELRTLERTLHSPTKVSPRQHELTIEVDRRSS